MKTKITSFAELESLPLFISEGFKFIFEQHGKRIEGAINADKAAGYLEAELEWASMRVRFIRYANGELVAYFRLFESIPPVYNWVLGEIYGIIAKKMQQLANNKTNWDGELRTSYGASPYMEVKHNAPISWEDAIALVEKWFELIQPVREALAKLTEAEEK